MTKSEYSAIINAANRELSNKHHSIENNAGAIRMWATIYKILNGMVQSSNKS